MPGIVYASHRLYDEFTPETDGMRRYFVLTVPFLLLCGCEGKWIGHLPRHASPRYSTQRITLLGNIRKIFPPSTDSLGRTTQRIELTRVTLPGDPMAFLRKTQASIEICRAKCIPLTRIETGLRVGNKIRVVGVDALLSSSGPLTFSKRVEAKAIAVKHHRRPY